LGGLVDVVAEQFEDLFQERIEVGYDVLGDRGPKPQGVRAARDAVLNSVRSVSSAVTTSATFSSGT